jgi:hypothetical protein
VTDAGIRAAARALDASGLAEHGWAYVNIDDYWQMRSEEKTRSELMGLPATRTARSIRTAIFRT